MSERVTWQSPRTRARIAGVFYLLTFVAGGYALVAQNPAGAAAGLVAGICYLAVTLLFYDLFRPVSRWLSALAALVSLAGIVAGAAGVRSVNPLVFFGGYCLLIGYLIVRSTFLPRVLGALMMCAGLGWLTFLSPALSTSLSPYNLAPGIIGEGILTLWLLVVGVHVPKWQEQAGGRAALDSRMPT
jgi:hypothetical protein